MKAKQKQLFLQGPLPAADLTSVHPADREAAEFLVPREIICQGSRTYQERYSSLHFRVGALRIKNESLRPIPDDGLFFGDPVRIRERGGQNSSHRGRIFDIRLHKKQNRLCYRVHTGRKLLFKRYFSEDLEAVDPDLKGLEQALIRDRKNYDLWSVYGDLLLSQNDPRGELCALELQLRRSPDLSLQDRIKALNDNLSQELVREFQNLSGNRTHRVSLRLSYGAVSGLYFQYKSNSNQSPLRAFQKLLRTTLEHKNSVLLEELDLGVIPPALLPDVQGILKNHIHSLPIRKLSLDYNEPAGHSPFIHMFPELEHLVLTVRAAGTLLLSHPGLKTLELNYGRLSLGQASKSLTLLLQNPPPALQSFSIKGPYNLNYAREEESTQRKEEWLAMICESALFSKLRVFQLLEPLRPEEFDYILKNAALFQGLESFDFNRRRLTKRQIRKLEKLPGR